MTFDMFINAAVTLLVTIDPVGLAPLFLAITSGMDSKQRKAVALRGCTTAFGIMVLFVLVGSGFLALLGITLPAFRVAGGLLLFYIAFEMIFQKRDERKKETAQIALSEQQIHSVAVFPFAIPLLAGPGAISAGILLANEFSAPAERATLVVIIATIFTLAYFVFRLAEKLDRLIGETGRSIMTRFLGLILAALAVQFVADGVRALVAT